MIIFLKSRTSNLLSTSSTDTTVCWNVFNIIQYFSITRTNTTYGYVSLEYYEYTTTRTTTWYSYDHNSTRSIIRRCTNTMYLSKLLSTNCDTGGKENRFTNMVNLWWNRISWWLVRLLSYSILCGWSPSELIKI